MTDVIIQIIGYLFGAIVFVVFCWIVFMSWMLQKSDVDRDEDPLEAEARVQQIKDSMRGTL